MAILNSFVNDIFERIATEASSKFLSLSNLLWILKSVCSFLIRTRCILQEVNDIVARNSDLRATYPAWRACQTCYFRRDEISNEYVSLTLADIEKILIDLHRILIGGGEVNIFVICLFSFLRCNSLYLINSVFFSLSDMLWAIDLRISLYHCLLSHYRSFRTIFMIWRGGIAIQRFNRNLMPSCVSLP